MAVMAAKGLMKKGDEFIGKSIIGGTFHCKIEDIILKDKKQFIIPTVSGRGFITGTHQIMRDPSDPWPFGYRVSDTWPTS
jgi:proline racemase